MAFLELLGQKREGSWCSQQELSPLKPDCACDRVPQVHPEDNDSIKQMLSVMPECAALAAGDDANGLWLDSRWNDVRIATAAFFDAMGGGHKGREMDKNSVVRAALKAFGVPGKIMDDFLQGKETFVFKINDKQGVETTSLMSLLV